MSAMPQLLPCREAEHLGVGVTEARAAARTSRESSSSSTDSSAATRPPRDRPQPDLEPAPARRAPPLVTDHPVRDAVEPDQCVVPGGDFVEATPRRQERLGHGVIDEIIRQTSAAEVADRSVVAPVELGEHGVVA